MGAGREPGGHAFGDAFGGIAFDVADDRDDRIGGDKVAAMEGLQVGTRDRRERRLVTTRRVRVGMVGIQGAEEAPLGDLARRLQAAAQTDLHLLADPFDRRVIESRLRDHAGGGVERDIQHLGIGQAAHTDPGHVTQ